MKPFKRPLNNASLKFNIFLINYFYLFIYIGTGTILSDDTCTGTIPIPDLGAEVEAVIDIEGRNETGAMNGIGTKEIEIDGTIQGVAAAVGAEPIPEPDLYPETAGMLCLILEEEKYILSPDLDQAVLAAGVII